MEKYTEDDDYDVRGAAIDALTTFAEVGMLLLGRIYVDLNSILEELKNAIKATNLEALLGDLYINVKRSALRLLAALGLSRLSTNLITSLLTVYFRRGKPRVLDAESRRHALRSLFRCESRCP